MKLLVFLILAFCTVLTFGKTITVEPGDQVSDSLLSLFDGDTLFLMPGIYTSLENQPILTAGSLQAGVTITSFAENRAVLSGQNMERSVIRLEGPHSAQIVIENLVISGGNATGSSSYNGGGISANESNVSISNCLVTENTALIGGGIGAQGGILSLTHTTLSNNEALVTGGGLDLYATEFSGFLLKFLSNTSNDDGGGLSSYQSTVDLSSSLFTNNFSGDDGGAICVLQGSSYFSFLTVDSNEALDDGGGFRVHTIDSMSIVSSIVTSNSGLAGINVISTNVPYLSHVICWNNTYANFNGMDDPTGTNGNLSEDPLFADEFLNISQLASGQSENSPALDAGHIEADQSVIYELSTRTDSLVDTGTADIGFHHENFQQTGLYTEEGEISGGLVITPSPASFSSSVNISLPSNVQGQVSIDIFDSSGRSLPVPNLYYSASSNSWIWTPENSLPDGIFFIKTSWAGGILTGRVVVIR